MKKIINGKTVEFNSSTNRPDRITVDEIVYWRTDEIGEDILHYKQIQPIGNGVVSYPKTVFTK